MGAEHSLRLVEIVSAAEGPKVFDFVAAAEGARADMVHFQLVAGFAAAELSFV